MSDTDQVSVEERLVRIESALAHLQHDVEELNASLTTHFRRMKGFEVRFTRIEHELESIAEESDVRDPESEKPPHY
ncbi:MAG: SlyX family protein [Fuerstiella sp.]|nr:SlyX family protein [Fuerstiella sp.]MCP4856587.1 SlyX family protein [Fuerstiella sp.]